MSNTDPYSLSQEEWQEIIEVPAGREAWGLDADEKPSDFAERVYAAKFKFISGPPGYVGDLYILQGDALTGDAPMVLRRADDHTLVLAA